MSEPKSKYLFKAKTREGFCVKMLAEFLSNSIKFPHFSVNSKGIFLRSTDTNKDTLSDIEIPKENLPVFKCVRPINFAVNSVHLYRLLKTIKKKNAVTLFIEIKSSMQLGICIGSNDEKADTDTTFINIVYVSPDELVLPTGYGDPLVITAKRFQKLKVLHSVGGGEMMITIYKGIMKCFVNGKDLFNRRITLSEESGSDDEDKEEESEDQDEDSNIYSQTFTTQLITQLTKVAGQVGNVQVYYDDNLPLKMKINIGTIGTLVIFIKSKEIIEMLNREDEDEEEGEEGEEEEEPQIQEVEEPVVEAVVKKPVKNETAEQEKLTVKKTKQK